MMDDLIRRQDVSAWLFNMGFEKLADMLMDKKRFPPAQPEVKPIDYRDCADAMLMMWMWNVLTDGEYYRIMDKLNRHETERRSDG